MVAPKTWLSPPTGMLPTDCEIEPVVLLLAKDELFFGQRLYINPTETSKKNTPAAVSLRSRLECGVIWARSSGDK